MDEEGWECFVKMMKANGDGKRGRRRIIANISGWRMGVRERRRDGNTCLDSTAATALPGFDVSDVVRLLADREAEICISGYTPTHTRV